MPRKEHPITEVRHGDCFYALVAKLGFHLITERGLSY
jgi:hypothetical protein